MEQGEKWLSWAVELQSLAQAGHAYYAGHWNTLPDQRTDGIRCTKE